MGSVSRNIVVVAATAVFLAAVTAAALMLGASSVSLPELATWLFGGDVSATARNILENVRVPRVLAALLAGAALATSGALIQACLDNPLASPNVIGVNSGAGLAVLLAASLVPGALWLVGVLHNELCFHELMQRESPYSLTGVGRVVLAIPVTDEIHDRARAKHRVGGLGPGLGQRQPEERQEHQRGSLVATLGVHPE